MRNNNLGLRTFSWKEFFFNYEGVLISP